MRNILLLISLNLSQYTEEDESGKPILLKKADPDVTLPAEEREIGGLGIFMTKKTMDEVRYEYKDGQNRLTLVKKLLL